MLGTGVEILAGEGDGTLDVGFPASDSRAPLSTSRALLSTSGDTCVAMRRRGRATRWNSVPSAFIEAIGRQLGLVGGLVVWRGGAQAGNFTGYGRHCKSMDAI